MESKTYCAFLRGVNVKGTNMKMAEACAVFQKTGMENVSSVLASGNILFTSSKPKNELKALLEKAMSAHFNYDVFLFLKNKIEIGTIFHKNPFEKHPDFHIYSFVGTTGIENTLMEVYENAKKVEGENALIIASNFYWKVPKGNTMGSEFGKILGRKNLKDKFTSRNLNTIEKILKKI